MYIKKLQASYEIMNEVSPQTQFRCKQPSMLTVDLHFKRLQ